MNISFAELIKSLMSTIPPLEQIRATIFHNIIAQNIEKDNDIH